MGKNKLQRFDEMAEFEHVVQPKFEEVFKKDYKLKGKWAKDFFNNNNPIILELACGKGEYTIGLARKFPNINFIGIDIKGARMWRGALTAKEEGLKNVGFLRTRIEIIDSFFKEKEISEIWITFPDPQLKKPKKRLTSAIYLERYKKFLTDNGFVNLKTDNKELFFFTKEIAEQNQLEIHSAIEDIYNSPEINETLKIRTFYESMWLEKGLEINYIRFSLHPNSKTIINPPIEED